MRLRKDMHELGDREGRPYEGCLAQTAG